MSPHVPYCVLIFSGICYIDTCLLRRSRIHSVLLVILSHPIFPLNLSRQNALLATISEKDANIALLELSPTVGSDGEVRKFKAEKDKLVNELKEQVKDIATSQKRKTAT